MKRLIVEGEFLIVTPEERAALLNALVNYCHPNSPNMAFRLTLSEKENSVYANLYTIHGDDEDDFENVPFSSSIDDWGWNLELTEAEQSIREKLFQYRDDAGDVYTSISFENPSPEELHSLLFDGCIVFDGAASKSMLSRTNVLKYILSTIGSIFMNFKFN